MKKPIYDTIEDFFEIDKEHKRAHIPLSFACASDIFDENVGTKIPMFNEEFIDCLECSYNYVPDQYHLVFEIGLGDLEGYTIEQMEELFKTNLKLRAEIHRNQTHDERQLGVILCLVGTLFILISLAFEHYVGTETLLKQILAYVFDITATVPFWGAMEIFLINGNERRQNVIDYITRFHSIRFYQK